MPFIPREKLLVIVRAWITNQGASPWGGDSWGGGGRPLPAAVTALAFLGFPPWGRSAQRPGLHPTPLQGPCRASQEKQRPSQTTAQGSETLQVGIVEGWVQFRICP